MNLYEGGPILTVEEVNKLRKLGPLVRNQEVLNEWKELIRKKNFNDALPNMAFNELTHVVLLLLDCDIERLREMTLEGFTNLMKANNMEDIYSKFTTYLLCQQRTLLMKEYDRLKQKDTGIEEGPVVSKERLVIVEELRKLTDHIYDAFGYISIFLHVVDPKDYDYIRRMKVKGDYIHMANNNLCLTTFAKYHSLEFYRCHTYLPRATIIFHLRQSPKLMTFFKDYSPSLGTALEQEVRRPDDPHLAMTKEVGNAFLTMTKSSLALRNAEQTLRDAIASKEISVSVLKIFSEGIENLRTVYQGHKATFDNLYQQHFPQAEEAAPPVESSSSDTSPVRPIIKAVRGRGGARARGIRGGRGGRAIAKRERWTVPPETEDEQQAKKATIRPPGLEALVEASSMMSP